VLQNFGGKLTSVHGTGEARGIGMARTVDQQKAVTNNQVVENSILYMWWGRLTIVMLLMSECKNEIELRIDFTSQASRGFTVLIFVEKRVVISNFVPADVILICGREKHLVGYLKATGLSQGE
jgi:hypothetical protein